MTNGPPERKDFVVHGTLDEECAYEALMGLSVEEVASRLADDFWGEREHFFHMGVRAFEFYLPALLAHLRRSADPPDELGTFVNIAEDRLEDLRGMRFAASRRLILDLLDEIAEYYAHAGCRHKARLELQRTVLAYRSVESPE